MSAMQGAGCNSDSTVRGIEDTVLSEYGTWKRIGLFLLVWVFSQYAMSADSDGRWRLTINGHNTYYYGEPQLGGGLRVPWEVVIRFRIEDAMFTTGSGSAQMTGQPLALSHPPGWVHCEQVQGSYLDSSLTLHETPRVRFSAFPVAGELVDNEIVLRPGYRPPGNYLAVTYECVLHDSRASHWFALAERGKQVLGKRQDAEKRVEGERLSARVREVVVLPPETGLTLPLRDGWHFVRGSEEDGRQVEYRLQRE